jgi:tetratricopeptide (TPR) repeat protein
MRNFKGPVLRRLLLTLTFVPVLFVSCSSAPKRPAEVFLVQTMTENQLDRANKEADRGNYGEALKQLTEARRMAVSSDRPHLRIRVSLSQGNVLSALGRGAEAETIWRTAETEAAEANETTLAAACRVYLARDAFIRNPKDNAGEVLARVRAETVNLKSDKLFTALSWTVIGLAEKELGRFADAEKSVRSALSIHEGSRYLELAAYDWYLIASIRSVAGSYADAVAALDTALSFDRRAENTYGLAMSWAAKGEVYRKMGDEAKAAEAWRRSAEIFRTLMLENQAAAMEKRINEK